MEAVGIIEGMGQYGYSVMLPMETAEKLQMELLRFNSPDGKVPRKSE